MVKLRDVFTVLKMTITIEASKVMPQDQFDVSNGPNLKINLKMCISKTCVHMEFPLIKHSLDTIL